MNRDELYKSNPEYASFENLILHLAKDVKEEKITEEQAQKVFKLISRAWGDVQNSTGQE